MFPMTLYEERLYPGAPFKGLSDVIFATSRDGIRWDRRFREPFIAPGPDERNWTDRNPMMGAGIVETGPNELSMVLQELHKSDDSGFRRCTIRKDGFVSVHAPYFGWSEFTTQPFRFSGTRLELNYSTSGGGSIFVEMQYADGTSGSRLHFGPLRRDIWRQDIGRRGLGRRERSVGTPRHPRKDAFSNARRRPFRVPVQSLESHQVQVATEKEQ